MLCELFDCSSIALWAVVKKKPLVRRFHDSAATESGGEEGRGEEVKSDWVTAVAAFPNTDLVASGQSLVLLYIYTVEPHRTHAKYVS